MKKKNQNIFIERIINNSDLQNKSIETKSVDKIQTLLKKMCPKTSFG